LIKLNEVKGLGHSVSRIALPVLVEQACITLMGVINAMMVSHIGGAAIAATNMIDAISMLIISFFSSLAVGSTVTIAQYIGGGDREKANGTVAQSLASGLLMIVAATLAIQFCQRPLLVALYGGAKEPALIELSLQYLSIVLWSYIPIAMANISFGILRGAGDTRTPMKVAILMSAVNICLSYVLINGLSIDAGILVIHTPAFGIRGAATGLLIARSIGPVLGLIALLRGSRQIRLTGLRHFRWRPDLLGNIFRLGLPSSAEVIVFQFGKLLVQTFIVRLGITAIAANAIAGSIFTLLIVPAGALSVAAMTLVGQQIGHGQPEEAKRQLKFLVGTAMVLTGLLSLVGWPLLGSIIGLYSKDPAITAATRQLLTVLLVALPLAWPAAFITPAGLRGAGDVVYTLVISLASMWALRILLAYALTAWLPLGVMGIWLAMYADWIGRSALYLNRLRGTRWQNKSILRRGGQPAAARSSAAELLDGE
jgi:putative MATE family efflux protein